MWEVSNLWVHFKHFSPDYYFWCFIAVISFMAIIVFFGLQYFSKNNKKLIPVFAFWFLFYFLFYGMFEGSFSQLRYFLPIIPVVIYFFIATVIYIAQLLKIKGYV